MSFRKYQNFADAWPTAMYRTRPTYKHFGKHTPEQKVNSKKKKFGCEHFHCLDAEKSLSLHEEGKRSFCPPAEGGAEVQSAEEKPNKKMVCLPG